MSVRSKSVVAVLLLLGLWFGADAFYAALTQRRFVAWEETIERDARGVRRGCAAFSSGDVSRTILLVHGFADSPALYRRMGPFLARAGYRFRAIRLPGFAEEPFASATLRVDDWRDCVVEAVKAERDQGREVWVMAHSLGAAVSLDALRESSAEIKGFLFMAPLFDVSSRRSPLFSPHAWFKVGDALLQRTSMLENTFPVDMANPEAAKGVLRDRFIHLQVYRNLFDLLARLAKNPPDMHLPLFMAVTSQDQVIDSQRALEVFEDWPSTQKRLLQCNESGHVLPLDAEWQRMTEEMIRWMGEQGER